MATPAIPYLQVVKTSRDLRFDFWDSLHISRYCEFVMFASLDLRVGGCRP